MNGDRALVCSDRLRGPWEEARPRFPVISSVLKHGKQDPLSRGQGRDGEQQELGRGREISRGLISLQGVTRAGGQKTESTVWVEPSGRGRPVFEGTKVRL